MLFGAMVQGVAGIAIWEWILIQLASTIVAVAVFVLPFVLRWSWRRRKHEARVEATCDAVLGVDADPNVGRMIRQAGLAEHMKEMATAVAELSRNVGKMNGSNKTICQHVESIDARLSVVEAKAD